MFKSFTGFHLVEAYHKVRYEKRFHPNKVFNKTTQVLIVLFVTLLLWNLPTTAFGIEDLTVVQQRIIAIFAFATLMWLMEVVPSWATSVAIIGMMLLFTSDSGIKWMCNPEKVGELLSYKGIMACFADPVIMLFIGGFILAIAATMPSWQRFCLSRSAARATTCCWASCSSRVCSRCLCRTPLRQL